MKYNNVNFLRLKDGNAEHRLVQNKNLCSFSKFHIQQTEIGNEQQHILIRYNYKQIVHNYSEAVMCFVVIYYSGT